jgi:RNA polymerase sigma factor for flagellar operon FliA
MRSDSPQTASATLDPAASKLVEQHLPLVRLVVAGVAAKFPRHADREDLASAGSLGLVEAARRFDPSLGVPFARYASTRIRGAVLDAARTADFAPRSVRGAEREIAAVSEALSVELGREPTRAEVAGKLGLSLEAMDSHDSRQYRGMVLSLDAPAEASGFAGGLAESLIDSTAPDPLRRVEQRERYGYVRDAVGLLPDRLRAVVVGYFLEGRTSAQLAEDLGVTESRISQLRSEGLALLRAGIEAQYRPAAAEQRPAARGARAEKMAQRNAAFAGAIAAHSTMQTRLRPAVATVRRTA